MRKIKFSWNLKTKCVIDFLLTVSSSSMKDYTCHSWGAHKRQTFTLISTKLMWILKFFLHLTGYSNTKESFPSCMFVVMASGKCEPHTYFTFLQRILTFTHIKKFNIFCIIYVAMSNIHFSGLDNVKMTCITQISFKITIRKRHVYIDIRWPWKWNQYFYLAIWEDERSKIKF